MFGVVFMMLFAVVLSREGGICQIDAHLLCNINVLVPYLFYFPFLALEHLTSAYLYCDIVLLTTWWPCLSDDWPVSAGSKGGVTL